MCACVHRSTDWIIWLNYEVVEFQTWSGIDTVLDTVASDDNLLYTPPPPVFATFWIVYSILPDTAPHQYRKSLYHHSVTPAPHHLSCHKTFSTWTSPTPTTNHPPASAARLCVLRRVPGSDAVSCDRFPPPFSDLILHTGPCRHLGVHLLQVPLSSLFTVSLPVCFTASQSIMGISISRFTLRARERGQGVSNPW